MGARNKATLVARSIIGEHLADIVSAACLRVKEGSDRAQALIIGRAVAPARHRPVTIDLPETATLSDILAAHRQVMRCFAAGELTAEEAEAELAQSLGTVAAQLGIQPG